MTLDETGFESISHETVRQRLKTTLKPHLSNYWTIPPKQDADFVYYLEDVLDLYHEPYDETRPVICFDESSNRHACADPYLSRTVRMWT
ncbi:hypothetical protein [Natrinema caseinilyticum]|uniref:hypothetical protein n=1 Tax=Natrinema caseinilyticum TaxID=2961570 RepID=UPI0020C2F217|nr:hypothetical protein [Natrinema caseinilyticum]